MPDGVLAEENSPAIDRIMAAFESLGDNCEFGIVQRYCGIEPLGLFRFAGAPLPALVRALDADLAGYGDEGDLELLDAADGTVFCRSRAYGFAYGTGEAQGTDRAKLLARETRKVGYLRRRLMEDLASGEKMLVRKGPPEEGAEARRELRRAVRRLGPSPILHVREAAPGEAPGTVRQTEDGDFEGLVRRFAPADRAIAVDLETWTSLCRAAYGLRHGPVHSTPAKAAPVLSLLQRRPRLHVTRETPAGLTTFRRDCAAGAAANGEIHTFSAWIWLPKDFEAREVFAAVDYDRLGWREADLSARECWQRIWTAARIPVDRPRLRLGLVVVGAGRKRLWSTGWRLDRGPLPPPDQPPSMRIGRGLGAWLARLRW